MDLQEGEQPAAQSRRMKEWEAKRAEVEAWTPVAREAWLRNNPKPFEREERIHAKYPAVTPEAEPVSPPVVAPKDKDITEEFVKKQGVTGKLRRDIARGKTKIMRKADGTLYTSTTKKKQFREHGI